MIQYIQEENYQTYRTFKYKGGSYSISYQYLWSPFAEYLLKFVPINIAPNTITLSAFIILIITHIVFVSGCYHQQPIASWRLILMGISIFVYQNLDNMDGKQARRTKTASPLGMLFDHGSDAVSSFLISIQVMEIIKFSTGTEKIIALSGMVMMSYFCAMWAQYSTGVMKLGMVNPIDEGLPSYALFAIISIYIPHTIWNENHIFATLNKQVFCFLWVLFVPVVYYMSKDNWKNAIRPKKEINTALLLPLSYVISLVLLYLNSEQPLQEATWPLFYCLMFSWSRNMIQIQVCAVVNQKFNPFNFGTLSFILPSIAFNVFDISSKKYFTILAIIQFLIFIEFAISIVRQSAKVLNIHVFSIPKQRKSE